MTMPQSTQSSSTSIGKHGSVCNLSEFLSLFDGQTLPIIGDGNCLFRCFSHIFYCSQEMQLGFFNCWKCKNDDLHLHVHVHVDVTIAMETVSHVYGVTCSYARHSRREPTDQ